MKQRLKECQLCGALLRPGMAETHIAFHKSTPSVPARGTKRYVPRPTAAVIACCAGECRVPGPPDEAFGEAIIDGKRAPFCTHHLEWHRRRGIDVVYWDRIQTMVGARPPAPLAPRITHDPNDKLGPDDVNGVFFVPDAVAWAAGKPTPGQMLKPPTFGDPNSLRSTRPHPHPHPIPFAVPHHVPDKLPRRTRPAEGGYDDFVT